MKFIKKVSQGDLLPPFYGVAWYDYMRGRCVCLPVGLNLIAAAARAAWIFIKHGGRQLPMDPRAAYEQGLQDGKNRKARS